MKSASELLKENGIQPLPQRVCLLHYLMTHRTHPTADEIHCDLVKSNPTLSKTTVYNVLKLLGKHRLIAVINIEDKNARYDFPCIPHAHFQCTQCKRIFDIPFSEPREHFTHTKPFAVPFGFKVEETQIYHKGLCPICQLKIKLTNL